MEPDNRVDAPEKPKEELVSAGEKANAESKAKTEEMELKPIPTENGVEIAQEVTEDGGKIEEASIRDTVEKQIQNQQVEGNVTDKENNFAETEADSKPRINEEASTESKDEAEGKLSEIEDEKEESKPTVHEEIETELKDVPEGKLIEIEDHKEAKIPEIEVVTEEAQSSVIEQVEPNAPNEAIAETTSIVNAAETKTNEEEPTPAETQEPEQNVLEDVPLRIEIPIEVAPSRTDENPLDPEILKRIENHLDSIGISNHTVKIEPITKTWDKPIRIFQIEINGRDNSGSNTELNWLVKVAAPAESVNHMVEIGRLFQNEELMYRKVFPAYQKLEDKSLVTKSFNSYPKYQVSSTDFLKEFVVTSEMTSLGYVQKDRKELLHFPEVKLAMKAYGKLHALSYALRNREPGLFAELSDVFKSNFAVVNEVKEEQRAIMEKALAMLDATKETAAYNKFFKFIQDLDRISTKTSTNEYSVLGYYGSNVAFLHKNIDDSNTVSSICFLDFQNARYASPACDLSHFLFARTNKAFRDQRYYYAIKLYYYTLCGHLNDLGYDPEKVLPYEVLEAELKRYSIISLYTVILEIHSAFKDAEDQGIFGQRIGELINDFAQKGYFSSYS